MRMLAKRTCGLLTQSATESVRGERGEAKVREELIARNRAVEPRAQVLCVQIRVVAMTPPRNSPIHADIAENVDHGRPAMAISVFRPHQINHC